MYGSSTSYVTEMEVYTYRLCFKYANLKHPIPLLGGHPTMNLYWGWLLITHLLTRMEGTVFQTKLYLLFQGMLRHSTKWLLAGSFLVCKSTSLICFTVILGNQSESDEWYFLGSKKRWSFESSCSGQVIWGLGTSVSRSSAAGRIKSRGGISIAIWW